MPAGFPLFNTRNAGCGRSPVSGCFFRIIHLQCEEEITSFLFCSLLIRGKDFHLTLRATADFPAEMSYSINAKPIIITTDEGTFQQPTTGTITAFMDVHTQEARENNEVPEADFVYKESTTASGYISNFVKSMYYQDGALRI